MIGKDGACGWDKALLRVAGMHKSSSESFMEETASETVSHCLTHDPLSFFTHLLICLPFAFSFCKEISFYVPNNLIIVVL